jgi:hypothetical protein
MVNTYFYIYSCAALLGKKVRGMSLVCILTYPSSDAYPVLYTLMFCFAVSGHLGELSDILCQQVPCCYHLSLSSNHSRQWSNKNRHLSALLRLQARLFKHFFTIFHFFIVFFRLYFCELSLAVDYHTKYLFVFSLFRCSSSMSLPGCGTEMRTQDPFLATSRRPKELSHVAPTNFQILLLSVLQSAKVIPTNILNCCFGVEIT